MHNGNCVDNPPNSRPTSPYTPLYKVRFGRCKGWQKVAIRIAIALALTSLIWNTASFDAIAASPPALTLNELDQRLSADAPLIDLSNLTIDLRAATPESQRASPPKQDFANQFYQRLQPKLNPKRPKSGQAIGLDLSNSLILGDFDLIRLSQRIPAYSTTLSPELDTFNQNYQRPTPDPAGNFGSSSRALSRFLLPPAELPRLDTYSFQGPLLLKGTCFSGTFKAADIYFLNRIDASSAIFTQKADWQAAKFASSVSFSQAQFQQESSFKAAVFAGLARFNQTKFNGTASWQSALFYQLSRFAQARFEADVDFGRAHWKDNADFERSAFQAVSTFQKSRFDQALFLTEAQMVGPLSFRQAQFQAPISLRGAHVLNQIDFGDARFARVSQGQSSQGKPVTINVADLDFSASSAQILGSPGQIGRRFSVPTLTSNETVLRNLVRNFRALEQIGDANQLEYTTERLRLEQIRRQIFGIGLNQASAQQLVKLGFSAEQATAVVARRQQQPFVSRAGLLDVDGVDLATYLKVRDRLTTRSTNLLNRIQRLWQWLILAGLLVLSNYGTSTGLTFGVGLLVTTAFAVMYWLVDRYRRLTPCPILPTKKESITMVAAASSLAGIALGLLSQNSVELGRSLIAVGLLILPVPGFVVLRLYQQGRYHELMEVSYFVENGAIRRLQVLIARLPTIPKFPFFRERYTPILSNRAWNWLNYFDFSFNNWFKFGFNDIRLREKAVPGLISALVWYQWSLGVVYIVLLLWTLSRTIPGLNLLLYF